MLDSITTKVKDLFYGILTLLLPMVSPVLQPDDHHILRFYVAVKRVVRPTMHRIFILLRPNNAKSVKDLLFEINRYSQTVYKRQFDKHERDLLDRDEPSVNFDESLLFKLLQCESICHLASSTDAKWNTKGTLENCLQEMKNNRNILAHDEISLTFDELKKKLDLLEELCRNALIAAGLRSKQQVTTDVVEMEKTMFEVLLGGIDLWEPYREALKSLRLEQSAVLLREGRNDIQKLAKKLKFLNPFSWLLSTNYSHLEVEHTFTKLSLHGDKEIDMDDLLIATLPTGELPSCIILVGGPGIGKSTLTRFMVHDWLSLHPIMSGMGNVDLLLPVELRYVKSDTIKELITKEILPSLSNHLQNDDILTALNNVSVVWVLDGFDEASEKTKEVVKELLRKSPEARILITTRTECRREIESYIRGSACMYMCVDIKGFSTDAIFKCAVNIIYFSSKDYNEAEETYNKFCDFLWKENTFYGDIFGVPLFLIIVLILWLDNPTQLSTVKTMSALFSVLLDHIINKLMDRNSFRALGERNSSLRMKYIKFLDYLGFILWIYDHDAMLSNSEVDALEEKCKSLGIPFKESMSAIFVSNERETAAGVTEEYTVAHRTMREFLSARAFCNHMVKQGWDVMTTVEEWFRMTRDTKLYNPDNVNCRKKCNTDDLHKERPHYDMSTNAKDLLAFRKNCLFWPRENNCFACFAKRRKATPYPFEFPIRVGKYDLIKLGKTNYWVHVRNYLQNNFLFNVVGILNNKKQMNRERAEQLVFLFYDDFEDFVRWFTYYGIVLKEGENSLFNDKLAEYLKAIPWTFYTESKNDLVSIENCLQYVVPDRIHLHYCIDFFAKCDDFFVDRIQNLKLCSSNICLDFTNILALPLSQVQFVRSYLQEFKKENLLPRLEILHCPLDQNDIQLIEEAVNLKEISLRVSGYNLPELANYLNRLTVLETLRIVIDMDNYDELELPVLNIGHETLTDFVLVLPNILGTNSHLIGEMIQKVSLHVKHVILIGDFAKLNDYALTRYVQSVTSMKSVKAIDFVLDITESPLRERRFYYENIDHSFVNQYSGIDIKIILLRRDKLLQFSENESVYELKI